MSEFTGVTSAVDDDLSQSEVVLLQNCWPQLASAGRRGIAAAGSPRWMQPCDGTLLASSST
jgi:hypothetical protein